MAAVVQEGAVPLPFDVRNCPDVPYPDTMPIFPVPFPIKTCPVDSVVDPVPPRATEIVVPFQVPEVIVPMVAKLLRVVIALFEVVAYMSTNCVFKAEKLLFMVVLDAESVSLPCMVVIEAPKELFTVSSHERGIYLYTPTKVASPITVLIAMFVSRGINLKIC